MAASNYIFDRTGGKAGGFRLGRAHEELDNAMNRLQAEYAAMTQMLDGDGSQDTHYLAHVTAYGFPTTAVAHAAYLELGSVVGKLTNDASQTVVYTAIKQFLARFRN